MKSNLKNFAKETNSNIAKKILNDFDNEILNFLQVCPIEMLDKLKNPDRTISNFEDVLGKIC